MTQTSITQSLSLFCSQKPSDVEDYSAASPVAHMKVLLRVLFMPRASDEPDPMLALLHNFHFMEFLEKVRVEYSGKYSHPSGKRQPFLLSHTKVV